MSEKPNIEFLRKVEAGEVFRVRGVRKKTGGYMRFVGGELTAGRHARAGYINMPGMPELGRPSKATLTDRGRSALHPTPREGE